jgi:hypothetical protein
VESLRDLIELIDREIAMLGDEAAPFFADDLGYRAIQAIPGVGPVLAAIFVAEIGDVSRFKSARHLCSWAGLTPTTTSPTTRSAEATSPNRAVGSCAGRPSRPSPANEMTPRFGVTTLKWVSAGEPRSGG